MHGRRVSLFSFASPAISADVIRAVAQCGYTPLHYAGVQWFAADSPADGLPPLVVLEEGWKDAPNPQELLKRRPAGAWIGVFAGSCRALAGWCADFIVWPARTEELKLRLDRIAGPAPANEPADRLVRVFATFNVVSESALFRRVLERVEKISRVNVTTLIEGETGTGKEVIARAIHYMSARRGRPFIPVNCGAIPEGLVESEFFGHERGAFTDARESRIGVVEQASGGTLFLDEVEALSPKGQVTLLRLLQENEFRPVGSSTPKRADVRVIAASNASLADLAGAGSYRSDLYYRLNVLGASIPPLRQRPEDLEPLCRHFLASLRSRYGGPAKVLSPQTKEWMQQYSWPGNVRELENLLHRAYVFSESTVLDLVPGSEEASASASNAFHRDFQTEKTRVIDRFEREYLTWVLATSGGNVTRAAQLAGKERRAMGKLIKKHRIDRSSLLTA